jgi:hypothetical protein
MASPSPRGGLGFWLEISEAKQVVIDDYGC